MASLLHPSSALIDTCVWVAYLMGVQPQCTEITELFEACARNGVTLLYAPTTLKDVFHIIPRQARRDAIAAGENVADVSFSPLAWAAVQKITEIAAAAPQALPECELAWMLRSRHADLGNNLIVAAAETSGADYVVTYDQAFISHYTPACVTPSQLLALL